MFADLAGFVLRSGDSMSQGNGKMAVLFHRLAQGNLSGLADETSRYSISRRVGNVREQASTQSRRAGSTRVRLLVLWLSFVLEGINSSTSVERDNWYL